MCVPVILCLHEHSEAFSNSLTTGGRSNDNNMKSSVVRCGKKRKTAERQDESSNTSRKLPSRHLDTCRKVVSVLFYTDSVVCLCVCACFFCWKSKRLAPPCASKFGGNTTICGNKKGSNALFEAALLFGERPIDFIDYRLE